MKQILKNYWNALPDFDWSNLLLRIPLAMVFITQGIAKMPFDPAAGAAFGLSALVWWFVVYGEILAGFGLLVGGLTTLAKIRDLPYVAEFGDALTRFSGLVMCCVMTGVIWVVLKPESLVAFILTDYLHFSLWVGGLYFALRGNWAVAVNKKQ